MNRVVCACDDEEYASVCCASMKGSTNTRFNSIGPDYIANCVSVKQSTDETKTKENENEETTALPTSVSPPSVIMRSTRILVDGQYTRYQHFSSTSVLKTMGKAMGCVPILTSSILCCTCLSYKLFVLSSNLLF